MHRSFVVHPMNSSLIFDFKIFTKLKCLKKIFIGPMAFSYFIKERVSGFSHVWLSQKHEVEYFCYCNFILPKQLAAIISGSRGSPFCSYIGYNNLWLVQWTAGYTRFHSKEFS